jgi:hypothetical protein
LKDGITGLASGPDGSIYVATWNGIVKLKGDGSIAKTVHPVVVKGCDSDPADHYPANASSPLLRGLGVDSRGNVYVAATSCHRVLKITPDGQVTSILKSERPLVSYRRCGKRRGHLCPRIHQRKWPCDGRLEPTCQETCERQHSDDAGNGSYRSLICIEPLK